MGANNTVYHYDIRYNKIREYTVIERYNGVFILANRDNNIVLYSEDEISFTRKKALRYAVKCIEDKLTYMKHDIEELENILIDYKIKLG